MDGREPDPPNSPSRALDYRNARIGAAAALFGAVVFLVIIDPFDDHYDVDPFVLTLLLAAGLTLLGLEALDLLGRK